MMANFHKLLIQCSSCKVAGEILALSFNSEAHLYVELKCSICGEKFTKTYSLIVLKEFADGMDFQESISLNDFHAKTKAEKATDDIFLRSFHINPITPQKQLRR